MPPLERKRTPTMTTIQCRMPKTVHSRPITSLRPNCHLPSLKTTRSNALVVMRALQGLVEYITVVDGQTIVDNMDADLRNVLTHNGGLLDAIYKTPDGKKKGNRNGFSITKANVHERMSPRQEWRLNPTIQTNTTIKPTNPYLYFLTMCQTRSATKRAESAKEQDSHTCTDRLNATHTMARTLQHKNQPWPVPITTIIQVQKVQTVSSMSAIISL